MLKYYLKIDIMINPINWYDVSILHYNGIIWYYISEYLISWTCILKELMSMELGSVVTVHESAGEYFWSYSITRAKT